MGEQWHFDPDSYLAMVRAEIPSYDRLQQLLADAATTGSPCTRILDLGSGTGITAASVLARHPGATLVGIDSSEEMLGYARALVPDANFLVAALEDPLPDGHFDLVVSAFAIHHLDRDAKADLFRRVADVLAPGGRFVLCDVVVPTGDVRHPVPLEPGVDLPSPLADQLDWLRAAGLTPDVVFAEDDLAVVAGDRT